MANPPFLGHTRGDQARDDITLAVATAYSRLLSPTRTDLAAFLAGPRSPVAAYEVAQLIVNTTPDADLALVIGRLLVHADDQVIASGTGSAPAAAPFHPNRRASDPAKA